MFAKNAKPLEKFNRSVAQQ